MQLFWFILHHNILPIFYIIFLGFLLAKKFNIDSQTISKIYFNIFLPAIVLVKIYETDIKADFTIAIVFGFLFVAGLWLLSLLITKFRNYKPPLANAFKNSVMFYNSGNYALPLIALVFHDSSWSGYAISVQVMIIIVQTLTTNTWGFYNAGRGSLGIQECLKLILKMPSVYALALAFLLKTIPYDFTEFSMWRAVVFLADGFVAVSLLAVGIQLSSIQLKLNNPEVYIASFTRLLGGPALAAVLIKLLGISGIMAEVLFISSAVPSAALTALIAKEFNNETEFATQVVLVTTLLSCITLTLVIYFSPFIN